MITIVDPIKRYEAKDCDILWGACADWAKPRNGEIDPLREAGLKINALDGRELKDNQIIPLSVLSMGNEK